MKKIATALITMLMFLGTTAVVIGADGPFTKIGFITDIDGPIPGNYEEGYSLHTDGNPLTTYQVKFSEDTVTPEIYSVEGLYLKSYSGSKDALKAYYDSKPEPWKTHLKEAVDGTYPFAYMNGGGDLPVVQLFLWDGAVYDLGGHTEVPMRIPGDYPCGIYTIETKEVAPVVTFKLIINGDRCVLPSVPEIIWPANNAVLTTAQMIKVDWTESTGDFPPFTYQYEAYVNPNYTGLIYSSVWLTSSEIPTPGTPEGVYYVRVRAKDSLNHESAWSNGSANPYKLTVDNTAPDITFSGFRDQSSAIYDSTPAIRLCGSVNTTGFIAWEWLLNNTESDSVNYLYKILSGPTAVGYSDSTTNTHYNGQIPLPGTYVVQVTGTDTAGNVGSPVTCSVTYEIVPVLVGPPTDKNQCKNDGWKTFNNPSFKNQGDCVSFVQSSPNAIGNKTK